MYHVSRDDARSDLMLSIAVFVFGPIALALLLQAVGLANLIGSGISGRLLLIVVGVGATMVVPLLLMRYRGERPAVVLGLGSGDRTLSTGLIAAVPLLVVGAIALLLAEPGDRMILEHPLIALRVGNPLGVLVRLVVWVSVIGLATYATVKARDAFGSFPRPVDEAAWRIGRILAIAAAVTTLLAILVVVAQGGGAATALGRLLWPLGVAGAVWVILRRTSGGGGTTSIAALVTPTVIAAVGNFALALFNPAALVFSLYAATLSGGVGLGVGILAERTRRAGGIFVLAALIALGTSLPTPVRVFF